MSDDRGRDRHPQAPAAGRARAGDPRPDRPAGLHVCEAELRYTLRWNDQEHESLLELLDELEQRGLIESALHFRLTDRGRAQLPDDYEPPLRCGTGIPWKARP